MQELARSQRPQQPVFQIGVTGRMLLDDALPTQQAAIRLALQLVLEQLFADGDHTSVAGAEAQGDQTFQQQLQTVVPPLRLLRRHCTLLTSLAPGADQLAAQTAYELGIPVIGCLPFPERVYANLSTFVWKKHRIDRGLDLDAANSRRQMIAIEWLGQPGQPGTGKCADQFCVRLSSERAEGIDDQQLEDRWLALQTRAQATAAGSSERAELEHEMNLRYRAAGEYVAVQSHLLIAIVDSDDPQEGSSEKQQSCDSLCPDILIRDSDAASSRSLDPGTAAIVQVKLSGITPGILDPAPSFFWSSSGPVIEIRFPAEWKTAAAPDKETKTTESLLQECGITLRFPVDSSPQQAWNTTLKTAACLREFQEHTDVARSVDAGCTAVFDARDTQSNDSTQKDVNRLCEHSLFHRCGDQLRTLLQGSQGFAEQTRENDQFLRGLREMTRIYDAAGSVSGSITRKYRRWQSGLIVMTAVAIFLLQLGGDLHHMAPQEQPATPIPNAATGSDAVILHNWANLLQFGSLVLLAFVLVKYRRLKNDPQARQKLDYRCLAEGVRVQVYWILAGLSQAVAASYPHRLRGEIDWFRRSLSALTAPYDRWPRWFGKLSLTQQRDALELVRKLLVEGQLEYSNSTFQRFAHQNGCSHEIACSFICAGLSLTLMDAILSAFVVNSVPDQVMRVFDKRLLGFLILVPFALFGIGVVLLWRSRGQVSLSSPYLHKEDQSWGTLHLKEAELSAHRPWLPQKTLSRPRTMIWREILQEAGYWAGTFPVSWLPRRMCYLPTTLWLWAVAICLAMIVPSYLTEILGGYSGVEAMLALLAAFYLLSGATILANSEKAMLVEQARQYENMARMHNAANRRMRGHLERIEELLNDEPIDKMAQAEIRARIQTVQRLIGDVGMQMLDENAEWIILHRSRPIEPVIGG